MESDQAMTEADKNLNNRIRSALSSDSSLRGAGQNFSLHSDNGVVTLNGTVATEKDKSDLENKIQRMTGVSRVDNNLQIAPQTSSSAARSNTPVTR
jgi:osmotically-inducible protein OsmY